MTAETDDELSETPICSECVGDSFLSNEISQHGKRRECLYCGSKGPTYTLSEMADRIEEAFEHHYARTPENPDAFQWAAMKDPEIDYNWERQGEQTVYAIMNAANIPEAAAADLQRILAERHSDLESAQMGEETEFAGDAYYEDVAPNDSEWRASWNSFERSVKTEARFFSRAAAQQLGALFDDIDRLRTFRDVPLVVDAGPHTQFTHFYRARAFQADSMIELALKRPDRELAAPPANLATAGRMNANGIATFYGATTPHIALSEVRPPVGSQVMVARFEVIRPLRLLDLNALKQVHVEGSIFDPRYARELGRMTFLRRLCDRMARPVMPDDQNFEYLPTQAVADYLATEGRVPLDGILFPSVQAGNEGLNVVLFQKASRCEELVIPRGTEIDVSTRYESEDGQEPDYSVIERVPPEKPEVLKRTRAHPFDFTPDDFVSLLERETTDDREPTLRIDLPSLRVHIVNAVKFETSKHAVSRHRWTKSEEEPF